jgi:hypothetical protein
MRISRYIANIIVDQTGTATPFPFVSCVSQQISQPLNHADNVRGFDEAGIQTSDDAESHATIFKNQRPNRDGEAMSQTRPALPQGGINWPLTWSVSRLWSESS